jgi:hypothetical protein
MVEIPRLEAKHRVCEMVGQLLASCLLCDWNRADHKHPSDTASELSFPWKREPGRERKSWIPACTGMTTRKTRIGKVDLKSTESLRTPRLQGEGSSVGAKKRLQEYQGWIKGLTGWSSGEKGTSDWSKKPILRNQATLRYNVMITKHRNTSYDIQ